MQTTIEIKDEFIIDSLITALEGGSNYWYLLGENDSMIQEFEGKSYTENIILTALNGVEIPIYDVDDENYKLGVLSKTSIENGLKLYLENGNTIPSNDNILDATDSDVLFQYCVLGSVDFG